MSRKWLLACLAGASLSLPAVAQQAKTEPPAKAADAAKAEPLTIGSKAPALQVEKFLKGEPVTGFEKGKVYVVEFWATWCGPCVAAMPHVSELQAKHKDRGLSVIGTNIWEDKKFNADTLAKVEKFVADQGDRMAYTVAYDGSAKKMDTTFMKAAGQNGIPCAFIIDRDGYVAYIGHPMNMDKTLEQVLDSKHDLKALAAAYEAEQVAEREANAKQNALFAAVQKKDFAAAYKMLDDMKAKNPAQALNFDMTKFQIMLNEEGNTDGAYALAREIVDGPAKDNAMLLNAIAWMIVDPEGGIEKKDLDLALSASTRCNELTKWTDAASIDTLARVHFVKGDVDKAIELQTKAVELATGAMKEQLEPVLDEYKAAKNQK